MNRPIHTSHRMGKSFSDVRAPAGRRASIASSRDCKGAEIEHAAGQFTDDDLVKPCPARKKAS